DVGLGKGAIAIPTEDGHGTVVGAENDIAVAVAVEIARRDRTWTSAALDRRAGSGVEQTGTVSQEDRHGAIVAGAARAIRHGQVQFAVIVEVVEESLLCVCADCYGRGRPKRAAVIKQDGYRAAGEVRNHQIGLAVVVHVSGGHGKCPNTTSDQGAGR